MSRYVGSITQIALKPFTFLDAGHDVIFMVCQLILIKLFFYELIVVAVVCYELSASMFHVRSLPVQRINGHYTDPCMKVFVNDTEIKSTHLVLSE